MKFRDLRQQYILHKNALDAAIQSVLDHADFVNGSHVRQLEHELSAYVGVKHCITCANGTDALQLALMTWKVGKGDAVFVPDFTFFSSGEVVPLLGATPVFVDIDKDTYNICPNSLERAMEYVVQYTKLKPRVIMAVDLFGQPSDFSQIRKLADQYNVPILEDAAQGFGGKIGERRACSFGDIATTSFFPAKPLGCYGDGGAVFTDNDEWAELLVSYREHGKGKDKYDNVRIGLNSRLDTLQAAVLLEKIKFFDDELELCNQVANEYTRRLHGIVKTPFIMKDTESGWAQYTICFESALQREYAMRILKEAGIPSAVYYKKPMHMQKAFQDFRIMELEYGVTEEVCKTCMSLPMHPYLNTDDIQKVTDEVIRIIGA